MNHYIFVMARLLRNVFLMNAAMCCCSAIMQQPFEVEPERLHKRSLSIGQLNFLHTTDVHGWLGSHLLQPDYDADWGDFVTFFSSFRESRLDDTQDLILIDSGDKHDGNGLSDATQPNGIDTTKIFNEQDYDLLTLGNHELYVPESTIMEYYATALSTKFKDKYVSSNVEFIKEDGELVPFGNKYIYFETPNAKLRILTLAFIFDFRRFNDRAKVLPFEEELKRTWFREMLELYPESTVDVLLVIGHMPVTDAENNEMARLHAILRKLYPNIIIQFFGGHSHVRDFVMFDGKSSGLQSGRFAETLGFLSIDNVTIESPKFARRYIDFNKESFKYHSEGHGKNAIDFSKGKQISKDLKYLREELQLDNEMGYVPKTYYMSARPLKSDENIYHLITKEVLPRLSSDMTNSSIGRYIMINTGAVRYDLNKGPFTTDTEYIVLPFPNEWLYMELPLKVASKIEQYLNKGPMIASLAPPQGIGLYSVDTSKSCPFIRQPYFTEGYTTSDDCGCKGDDTIHNSQAEYQMLNVVQSEQLVSLDENEMVHFIFYSFLQPHILEAVNAIDFSRSYDASDCTMYGGNSTKHLLRDYVKDITK